MNDAKVGGKIRGKIEAFSGKLSRGLPKVGQRLVREVLYGVQSRGSVRLSEIGRALGEETGMKKVIERLGRGLNRAGLREQVRKNLLEWAAGQIEGETLLVLDPTDISKPYAEKMQYLARVRDGSRKQLRDGYWCCQVVGVRRNSARCCRCIRSCTRKRRRILSVRMRRFSRRWRRSRRRRASEGSG